MRVAEWLLAKRERAVALVLGLTVLVVSRVNPDFLAWSNVRDMLVGAAPVAIVGCGVTFVILAGEIDISVGSMMGLLSAVLGLAASPSHAGLPVAVAVVATVALGALLGFVNGLLVAACRVPSIIVTLGMLTVLRGSNELVMGGEWIKDLPPNLRFIGTGYLLGLPICLWVAAVVIAVAIALARLTPIGLRIYAVGSNPAGARMAGLSVARTKLLVFTLSGLLVGVATVLSTPQLSVVESGMGRGLELLVVTCVVVGGSSITGGVGTITGTLLGVVLLTTVRTVLIYLRLGPMATYWERAIQGGFILLAVLADHVVRRRGGHRQ